MLFLDVDVSDHGLHVDRAYLDVFNLETTWTYNLAFSVSRFANLEFTSFLLKPLFSGFDILVSGLFYAVLL